MDYVIILFIMVIFSIASGLGETELAIGFGICLPSSCSGKQIRDHLQNVVRQMNATIANYDPEIVCNSLESIELDHLDAFVM